MITSPRLHPDHPDQSIECQEAIEARVMAIFDEAKAAGWPAPMVAAAIVDVADNLMLQADAMDEINRQIAVITKDRA